MGSFNDESQSSFSSLPGGQQAKVQSASASTSSLSDENYEEILAMNGKKQEATLHKTLNNIGYFAKFLQQNLSQLDKRMQEQKDSIAENFLVFSENKQRDMGPDQEPVCLQQHLLIRSNPFSSSVSGSASGVNLVMEMLRNAHLMLSEFSSLPVAGSNVRSSNMSSTHSLNSANFNSSINVPIDPKGYYECYMAVFGHLNRLHLALCDLFNAAKVCDIEDAADQYLDLYQLVQFVPSLLPRLYLMITVGCSYAKCWVGCKRFDVAHGFLEDLLDMCRGCQHPLKGLFVRYFLQQLSGEAIMGSDSSNDGSNVMLTDSEYLLKLYNERLDFVLVNFGEMNKLWVRMQHQNSGPNLRRKSGFQQKQQQLIKQQRDQLKLLVGLNLVRLSQILQQIDDENQVGNLDGDGENTTVLPSSIQLYQTKVLPRVLEQIVGCREQLAQQYLMEAISQVFPDEYHLQCLDQLLEALGEFADLNYIEPPQQESLQNLPAQQSIVRSVVLAFVDRFTDKNGLLFSADGHKYGGPVILFDKFWPKVSDIIRKRYKNPHLAPLSIDDRAALMLAMMRLAGLMMSAYNGKDGDNAEDMDKKFDSLVGGKLFEFASKPCCFGGGEIVDSSGVIRASTKRHILEFLRMPFLYAVKNFSLGPEDSVSVVPGDSDNDDIENDVSDAGRRVLKLLLPHSQMENDKEEDAPHNTKHQHSLIAIHLRHLLEPGLLPDELRLAYARLYSKILISQRCRLDRFELVEWTFAGALRSLTIDKVKSQASNETTQSQKNEFEMDQALVCRVIMLIGGKWWEKVNVGAGSGQLTMDSKSLVDSITSYIFSAEEESNVPKSLYSEDLAILGSSTNEEHPIPSADDLFLIIGQLRKYLIEGGQARIKYTIYPFVNLCMKLASVYWQEMVVGSKLESGNSVSDLSEQESGTVDEDDGLGGLMTSAASSNISRNSKRRTSAVSSRTHSTSNSPGNSRRRNKPSASAQKKLAALFKLLHQTIALVGRVHPMTALKLFLLPLHQPHVFNRHEMIAYEFLVSACSLYEDSISLSKEQMIILSQLIRSLYLVSNQGVLSRENYDTLITKVAVYSSRLLRKWDQVKYVCQCSILFWGRDPKKLTCELKSGNIITPNENTKVPSEDHEFSHDGSPSKSLKSPEEERELLTKKLLSGGMDLNADESRVDDMHEEEVDVLHDGWGSTSSMMKMKANSQHSKEEGHHAESIEIAATEYQGGEALLSVIKPAEDFIYRDPKRVLECLQKSLKIADACLDANISASLFVEILNWYIYWFQKDIGTIVPKYLTGLVDLAWSNIQSCANAGFEAGFQKENVALSPNTSENQASTNEGQNTLNSASDILNDDALDNGFDFDAAVSAEASVDQLIAGGFIQPKSNNSSLDEKASGNHSAKPSPSLKSIVSSFIKVLEFMDEKKAQEPSSSQRWSSVEFEDVLKDAKDFLNSLSN